MVDRDAIKRRFESLLPAVDERMRRLIAAAESLAIDYGGISIVSRATGVSRRAIARGIVELESGRFLGVRPLSRLDLEGGNPDTSGGKCSPTLRRAPGFVSAGEDVLHAGSIPSAVSSPSVCSRLD